MGTINEESSHGPPSPSKVQPICLLPSSQGTSCRIYHIQSESSSLLLESPKVIPRLLTHFMTSSIFFSAQSQCSKQIAEKFPSHLSLAMLKQLQWMDINGCESSGFFQFCEMCRKVQYMAASRDDWGERAVGNSLTPCSAFTSFVPLFFLRYKQVTFLSVSCTPYFKSDRKTQLL